MQWTEASDLINDQYLSLGQDSSNAYTAQIKFLLTQRHIPEKGWTPFCIQSTLNALAQLDSNNYLGAVGLGEREGRVASSMVSRLMKPREVQMT